MRSASNSRPSNKPLKNSNKPSSPFFCIPTHSSHLIESCQLSTFLRHFYQLLPSLLIWSKIHFYPFRPIWFIFNFLFSFPFYPIVPPLLSNFMKLKFKNISNIPPNVFTLEKCVWEKSEIQFYYSISLIMLYSNICNLKICFTGSVLIWF